MTVGRLRHVLLLGVALVCAAAWPSMSAGQPAGHAAGEDDSPWPDTERLAPNVRAIKSVVADLEHKVDLMELSAARYADWQACLRGVPVSEYGDHDRQFGYVYNEIDGTGRSHMPALAVDRTSRPGKEDYLFLKFSRRSNCRTDAPLPGGTAEPASVHHRAATAAAGRAQQRARQLRRLGRSGQSLRSTLTSLERRVGMLKRATGELLAASEQFDEWESCVSWVPVTEYGDPDGKFGYLSGSKDTTTPSHRPALAIDRSDWDDPDYMFLALVGGDRPGHTCQDEPGEAVD